MKRMIKHYDMSRSLFAGEPVYKMPAPRTEREKAERRMPAGVVIARRERAGIWVASNILRAVVEPASQRAARESLGAAMLGSAWFDLNHGDALSSDDATVMRHSLRLPNVLAAGLSDGDAVLSRAAEDMYLLAEGRSLRHQRMRERSQMLKADDYQKQVGRALGQGSLLLAAAPVADRLAAGLMPDYDQQVLHATRSAAHRMVGLTNELSTELGALPSLAQLPDPYSPLAVHIMRTAPAEVVDAYQFALQQGS